MQTVKMLGMNNANSVHVPIFKQNFLSAPVLHHLVIHHRVQNVVYLS